MSDWLSDVQPAAGMHRLDFDTEHGEYGAAETDSVGVVVPCPDCGFDNWLWVLLRQRECTGCGLEMTIQIEYGNEKTDQQTVHIDSDASDEENETNE